MLLAVEGGYSERVFLRKEREDRQLKSREGCTGVRDVLV